MNENPPLRAVLAGCGQMSKTWLSAAISHPDVEIVGLMDVHLPAANAVKSSLGLDVSTGTDLEKLLDDCKADLFLNCGPPDAHFPLSEIALKRGIHVLSEKPLATSMQDACILRDLANQKNIVYAVMQNRRYSAGIRNLKSYIADGIIGKVNAFYVDFFLAPHSGGFREQMDHVLLLDMSIHHFDMVRFLSEKNATSVQCTEWNPESSWYAHGANVDAHFVLENSLRFSYRGSWCTEGFATSWNGFWKITGSRGSIIWDGENTIERETVVQRSGLFSKTQKRKLPLREFKGLEQNHVSGFYEMIRAIRNSQKPETSADDNIQSLAMVFSAIESSKSQTVINIAIP